MTDQHPNPSATAWTALPGRLNDPEAGPDLPRRRARTWGLVLEARGIPCQSVSTDTGWRLLVPPTLLERAVRELRQYETENRRWPPPPPAPSSLIDNRFTTLCVLAGVGLFHNLTLHDLAWFGPAPLDWRYLGNAHAGRILAGEWWRLVTALTLHTGGLHLMSNLLIGGLFVMRLCRVVGSGLGWALVLASGVGGNLVNAWLQSPDHRAVGASTAIFGAVGVLAGLNMLRYRQNLQFKRRWALPVAAGLGLLAMLGVGGENTDLGAHLWGFACGLPLGLAAEFWIQRFDRPSFALGLLLGAGTLATVCIAWGTALGLTP